MSPSQDVVSALAKMIYNSQKCFLYETQCFMLLKEPKQRPIAISVSTVLTMCKITSTYDCKDANCYYKLYYLFDHLSFIFIIQNV